MFKLNHTGIFTVTAETENGARVNPKVNIDGDLQVYFGRVNKKLTEISQLDAPIFQAGLLFQEFLGSSLVQDVSEIASVLNIFLAVRQRNISAWLFQDRSDDGFRFSRPVGQQQSGRGSENQVAGHGNRELRTLLK